MATIDDVLRYAGGLLYTRPERLTNVRQRDKHVVRARKILCLALHRRGWSLSRIGKELGYSDHTTAAIHTTALRPEYEGDPELASVVDRIAAYRGGAAA